jgi:hypothetical protein
MDRLVAESRSEEGARASAADREVRSHCRPSDEATQAFDPAELLQSDAMAGEVRREERPTVPPPLPSTDYVAQARHGGAIEVDTTFDAAIGSGPSTHPFPGLHCEPRLPSIEPPTEPERPAGAAPAAIGPRIAVAGGSEPAPALAPSGVDARLRRVEERFAQGDYGKAFMMAEALLDEQPESARARRYVESCREMLRQTYLARLGDGARVPIVVLGALELSQLPLDHRAGFLLSRIDGSSSIDEILDVCGMPALDALRIIYELLQEGVIRIGAPRA